MRDVTLDISLVGLNVGDTINLQLVNSMGAVVTNEAGGYILDENITLSSETFTKSLLENSLIKSLTHYKLFLSSGIYYNFRVPHNDSDNKPHDLYSLFTFGCVSSIIDKDTGKLDKEFQKQLDIYFSGGNAHFNVMQQDVVNLYEYYADNIEQTANTIDIMKMMDEYLATVGV